MAELSQLTAEQVREMTYEELSLSMDELRDRIERIQEIENSHPAMDAPDPARIAAKDGMAKVMVLIGREFERRKAAREKEDGRYGGVDTMQIQNVPR